MGKPSAKAPSSDPVARDPGWRRVATGMKVYYWAWIVTFAFWAVGTVATVAAAGFNAPPRALAPPVSKVLEAIGPLGQRACWIVGIYGLWLCCAAPRRSGARSQAWLALTLATLSLVPSLLMAGARLADHWTPFLEKIREAQVICRLPGIVSALFVLGFLGKVSQAFGFPRGEQRRSLWGLGDRGYPGILRIGAIAVLMSVVLFYLPALIAGWIAGASHPVGWALWGDLSKRLAAGVIFLCYLLRVRDVGLSVEAARLSPSAGPPPFRLRRHRITLAVLGVFLLTSATGFWLRRCVWTAENALALAEGGDFDGATRTAQRVWPYDPRSRFPVRVQTAVCQVCHDPSFIDTRARAEEQARTLGKIAELQAEAGDKDFSRLIAAAKKLERASSRAEALASIAQAQTRVGDVEDAAVHILDAR